MKIIKIVMSLIIMLSISLSTSSCVVVKTDNGRHRGWYKNTNNPHNPISTNPGHGNGRNKGK